ncbi:ATP-dependent DNA helicase [Aquimarina agarilytica]|uniref:ATP-dependent DNA helicase n=1 Tax=Aquimarina agarilytica TaxID=1087449 RepID=UPI000289C1A5|nr:AAA family ATPase [Aquimarina agarilytica]
MTASSFYKLLKSKFPHTATSSQEECLLMLSDFLFKEDKSSLFLLKGYAGTGKTTLIGTLVSQLWQAKMKYVLLAPTGRAAKVIANYSGKQAQTIHRHIYYPKKTNNGGVSFTMKKNKFTNTLFIVDESSMIPDLPTESKMFENGSLLNDLLQYVYSGTNCKVLFIGDTAQLPPVKSDLSPALSEDILELNFDKNVTTIELNEVVRQTLDSGVLKNATELREQLQDTFFEDFKFEIDGFNDVKRLVEGNEIIEHLQDSYSKYGHEGTVIIVRSNKRANLYNQQIRQRILFKENELSTGDYLMVVKNNYFWLEPSSEAGFIANGDIIEVLEIFAIKELYTFRFAEVKIRMIDYPNMAPFETVLILDTLTSESASMSYDDSNLLYQEVLKDYSDLGSKYKKFLSVKSNSFFNALQVKFSYAITCHKSQGGQWPHVFVEQPYLPDGMNKDYLRWLYTAITRSQEQLHLIGFKNEDFLVSD